MKTTQRRPGQEYKMNPVPASQPDAAAKKLVGKVALITGGDSGIGKAVALLFAEHGASIVISYLNEHKDAKQTQAEVERIGGECLLIPGDIAAETHCKKIIADTIRRFKKLDILVNNAAIHYAADSLDKLTTKNLLHTFQVNIFSYFFVTKAALPHLKKGSCIINTASVVAYRGSAGLMDYSATKGAIVAFTRSLSLNLAKRGIRVNGVAPGPIWTPLIPASFPGKGIQRHGADTPLKRTGQPGEVAPCYLFLADPANSYMNGQFLHPNGGEVVNT